MLPGEAASPVHDYLSALTREAPGQVAAVYGVGSLALDDFSLRESNIDLVVVGEPALSSEQVARLGRAERRLERAGRRASLWYTTWEEIASDVGGGAALDTPMTRALLRNDPMAVVGPDWPVVGFDVGEFKAWCVDELRSLAEGRKGSLVMRRAVTPMVLEAARLAQGAVTGRLFSKSEAGEAVLPSIASRYRRILTDAVGYRRGAHTSMYWGPFERKYDAVVLVRDLLDLARGSLKGS